MLASHFKIHYNARQKKSQQMLTKISLVQEVLFMGNEALFRDKPVWKGIFTLAIPAVFTILIMVIYQMADMFFIAMLEDDTQIAAISVVSPVFSIATAVGTMLGAGGCAVIAKMLGAKQEAQARAVGSLCIWGSLLFGVIFAAAVIPGASVVLRILGATEDLYEYSGTYLRILALGAPVMLFSTTIGSVIRAEGAIIPGMLCNIAGTVANLILDPLFILVLHMGVAGAALATVIGNLAASILLGVVIKTKTRVLTFSPKPALQHPQLLLHTMAVGLPNALSSVLSGMTSTFSNQLLGLYGSGAIAAMAAAGRASMVISVVQMGICMGLSPMLAYNYGAGNLPRLKEILVKTAIVTAVFGLAATGLCFAFRDTLIGLFLKDTANVEISRSFLTFLLLASPLLGFFYLSSNYFQAAGNAFLATLISVLRQGALLIPCLYLFHKLLGLPGIGVAHLASDMLSVGISCVLFAAAWKKLAKKSKISA